MRFFRCSTCLCLKIKNDVYFKCLNKNGERTVKNQKKTVLLEHFIYNLSTTNELKSGQINRYLLK